jgi:hypothetical protein
MGKENQEEKIRTSNVDPVAREGRRGVEGRIASISETHPVSFFRAGWWSLGLYGAYSKNLPVCNAVPRPRKFEKLWLRECLSLHSDYVKEAPLRTQCEVHYFETSEGQ